MLVLSRKPGQQLHVGNDVTISVLEVRGSRVRIGVEAPHSTHVARAELREWDQRGPTKRAGYRVASLVV